MRKKKDCWLWRNLIRIMAVISMFIFFEIAGLIVNGRTDLATICYISLCMAISIGLWKDIVDRLEKR